MKKQSLITFHVTALMVMIGLKALAHDLSVPNADGKTIYYKWINNKTELQVSYWGQSSNYSTDRYTGNIVIPESVKYEEVSYRVTSIGNYAFSGCTGLTSVTIPSSIITIDYDAFNGCTGLTSINIPSSVIEIGASAFGGCTNLTSLTIPNSVITIGSHAFSDCSKLTFVTIPNSVKTIGQMAFSWCSALTSVTFSNSVETIGEGAFYNCARLASITIPNSVTYIGPEAFYLCFDLTSLVIGSGVTSIGKKAFSSTNLKKTIWLTNTPPSGYSNASGEVNYVSNDLFSFSNKIIYPFLSSYFDVDGIRYVPVSPSERTCDAIDCVYDESAANTKLSTTVNYKNVIMTVKNIQPYLAYGNKYIETLSIDTEGMLAHFSFMNCLNLKTVMLSDKVTCFGNSVFSGCSSLTSVKSSYEMPLEDVLFISKNITCVEDNAFNGCKAIRNVIIADNDSELKLGSNGDNPIFFSCHLDSVYIGRELNYKTSSDYGYSPFYRNTSLRAVKITDREKEISENEFYGCSNLQRVIIGNGVTSIGNWAFSGCSSLKFFAFGSQVKNIGIEAFSDCSALTDITSKAYMPPICGSQALDDINKWECKLFVPKERSTKYQSVDQWKEFFFIDETDLHYGNANGDGFVDNRDIDEISNYIMDKPSDKFIFENADANGDQKINIADIVQVVNIIKEKNTQ